MCLKEWARVEIRNRSDVMSWALEDQEALFCSLFCPFFSCAGIDEQEQAGKHTGKPEGLRVGSQREVCLCVHLASWRSSYVPVEGFFGDILASRNATRYLSSIFRLPLG